MMIGEIYHFRTAGLGDLPLLRKWQSLPHVAAWWGHDDPFNEDDLYDGRVSRWIISVKDAPFAYMQDYSVKGWDGHHFGHLSEGSRGIDQYIGDVGMLGLGHGAGFIGQRMRALFAAGAPEIAVDPHPKNVRAIAVYERLGFRIVGEHQKTKWGLIVPMVAYPPAA